jgi:hypothetical protein
VTDGTHTERSRTLGSAVASFAYRFVANNWKVALYVLLIILCVLFAPEEPLKFIYTEF